jgi:hypothetical protein
LHAYGRGCCLAVVAARPPVSAACVVAGNCRRKLSAEVVAGASDTATMRCSINITNLGDFADPRRVAEAARLAEEAGWDGIFVICRAIRRGTS